MSKVHREPPPEHNLGPLTPTLSPRKCGERGTGKLAIARMPALDCVQQPDFRDIVSLPRGDYRGVAAGPLPRRNPGRTSRAAANCTDRQIVVGLIVRVHVAIVEVDVPRVDWIRRVGRRRPVVVGTGGPRHLLPPSLAARASEDVSPLALAPKLQKTREPDPARSRERRPCALVPLRDQGASRRAARAEAGGGRGTS